MVNSLKNKIQFNKSKLTQAAASRVAGRVAGGAAELLGVGSAHGVGVGARDWPSPVDRLWTDVARRHNVVALVDARHDAGAVDVAHAVAGHGRDALGKIKAPMRLFLI